MEGISDIKIIGVDETRPPQIRKEPYINLFFKLSHQAPSDWCREFNSQLSKHPFGPKIKEKEGLFIETWVRKPEEVAILLKLLKATVADCSRVYIERIELTISNAKIDYSAEEETGEQGRLNKIIAGLEFDEIGPQ